VRDALRLAGFRVCYLIAVVTGAAAARLADDFLRPISIVAFAGCTSLAPRMR
jgi:hypothetical protein